MKQNSNARERAKNTVREIQSATIDIKKQNKLSPLVNPRHSVSLNRPR